MLGWLKKWLIGRELKKIRQPSVTEEVADVYLKDAALEHAQAMSLARRMNKANLLKAQARDVIDAAHEAADDLDEDEGEEGEEEETFEEFLLKKFGKPFLERFNTAGAAAPATGAPQISPFKQQVLAAAQNMSDEDLRKLIDSKT